MAKLTDEEKKVRKAEYDKAYRTKNKGKINADKCKYRKENPKRFAEYRRSAKRKALLKTWRKNIKVSQSKAVEINQNYSVRKNRDLLDKANSLLLGKKNLLGTLLRCTISRIEKAKGSDRINRAEIELDYTQQEFIHHIESQFKDGMSWEDRSKWHIDHIYPVSQFLKDGITCVKTINALSNLQPLWAHENLSKGAKVDG